MVIILWISLEKGECFHFNHSLGCVYHTLYIIRLLGWVYHLRWLICYPCSLTHVIILFFFFLIYCGTKHSDILQGTISFSKLFIEILWILNIEILSSWANFWHEIPNYFPILISSFSEIHNNFRRQSFLYQAFQILFCLYFSKS